MPVRLSDFTIEIEDSGTELTLASKTTRLAKRI